MNRAWADDFFFPAVPGWVREASGRCPEHHPRVFFPCFCFLTNNGDSDYSSISNSGHVGVPPKKTARARRAWPREGLYPSVWTDGGGCARPNRCLSWTRSPKIETRKSKFPMEMVRRRPLSSVYCSSFGSQLAGTLARGPQGGMSIGTKPECPFASMGWTPWFLSLPPFQ